MTHTSLTTVGIYPWSFTAAAAAAAAAAPGNDDDDAIIPFPTGRWSTDSFPKNIPNSDKYDKNVTNLLLTYSWLSVFRIFIHSASQFNDEDRDRDHYNKKIIEFLTAFLKIETKNKEFLDISIKQVEDQSFKSRQREKKVFTDLLKGMNSDGRKLMKEMKNIGLGIWREGRIGVVKYDKKAYDRNVELYPVDEDAEIENVDENPDIDDEEQSGYDNGDGDGNDDNDNDLE